MKHFHLSSLSSFASIEPWDLTNNASQYVRDLIGLCADDFSIIDEVAVHKSATIEPGALMLPKTILGRLGLLDQER